uniref:Uncharacterized protein n=1 Tax=Heterorhabditis bacteriophora TaxID=37862 RepID=A0A1I7W695_HETBA
MPYIVNLALIPNLYCDDATPLNTYKYISRFSCTDLESTFRTVCVFLLREQEDKKLKIKSINIEIFKFKSV